MLLVLVVMPLAAVVALLSGGRFRRLAERSWSGLGWLASAVAFQVLATILGERNGWLYPGALAASTMCVAAFLLRNLSHPGVGLLTIGCSWNAIVVVANGAMPVSLRALERAGLQPDPAAIVADQRHEIAGPETLLPWFGDVIPVALPWVGQAVSPGDVLVAAGAGLMVFAGMRGVSAHPPRHRRLPAEHRVRTGNHA